MTLPPALQLEHDRIMAKVEESLNRRLGQLRYRNRERCALLLLWVDAALVGVLTAQRMRHRGRDRWPMVKWRRQES